MCLDNLVGLKNICTDDSPTSGLYLNDLHGLSIAAADAAVNSERDSGVQLLRDKLSLAQETLRQSVRAHFASRLRMDSLIESHVTGYYQNDLESLSGSGKYAGIQLRLDNIGHAELLITSIRLQCQSSGDVNIKVFDLISGKLLDTITITTVANEVSELVINKKYQPYNKRLNLLFVYETSIDSYKTTLYNPYSNIRPYCCGANAGWYNCGGLNYSYVRAIQVETADDKLQKNLQPSNYTYGLSITHSLVCSVEPLVCQLAPSLAMPLLYKWAVEVLSEIIYSRRLNSIITLHAKEHHELRDEYESRYREAMDNIFQNIRVPVDTCYSCNPKVRSRTYVP